MEDKMPELQDVFSLHGEEYRRVHPLSTGQQKAMRDIQNCRTAALGGHMDVCDECGFTRQSYNSCRNRHCPKCQTMNKERWIAARKVDLLEAGYFHVVFTIPDTLNPIALQNQRAVYDILFKSAAETLSELATDKKYLGAQVGMTAILHTWGQNLAVHPHVHCIVPGGGLDSLGRWVNSRKKFFIPVKVLSRKFRGKFLYYLQQARLEFHSQTACLGTPAAFSNFITALYQKEWVVYCKTPFKSAACVVEYLGRYTHRTAISNNRIIKLENGKVSFRWRDYRNGNKQKIMTLTADEFIRRFLTHILPAGYTKIRHYGILSPRNKTTKLALCKQLTNTAIVDRPLKQSAVELLKALTGKDVTLCPCCGRGHFIRGAPITA
jgi:hypothetical protein